uniref:hypothetical protein n=1 Tax=Eubacterium cellulosolvens TaxID=29322 RepID=UPI000484500C|nr:hypothetical protein [[Eubacterium] cellulosolvens]
MSKELYLKYGPRNLFWLMDHYNDIHIRFSAELDHEIDGSRMEKAWEKTIEVYPVIGCVIEMEGKELFFYRADGENRAIRSMAPVNPGSEPVSGCVITATYYGRRISVSAYHTMVDGGGLCEIFKTLLYFYLSEHTGVCDRPASVQTEAGRAPDAYYHTLLTEDMSGFEPVPLHYMPFLKDYAEDEEMNPDEKENRYFSSLSFPVDAFMEKCREIGANPSSMLGLLMSRAFYELHPEEQKDLFFEITTSARKVFHSEGCISNCVSNVVAGASREDAVSSDPTGFVRKFRAEMDLQRSDDYVKTMRLFEGTYGHNYVNKQITLTYIGKVEIGANTEHISNFEMETNATQLVILAQVGQEFTLMLLLGKASQRYLDKVRELLCEAGVDAKEKTKARTIVKDSDRAVLQEDSINGR